MCYSCMPGQLPRTSRVSTIYLRDRNSEKTPRRKKGIEKNQLSHTSNAILKQTIPFSFKECMV